MWPRFPGEIRMPASALVRAQCRGERQGTLRHPAQPVHLAATFLPALRQPQPGLHGLVLTQPCPVSARHCNRNRRRDLPPFQGGWQCTPCRGLWGLNLDNTSYPEEMFADGLSRSLPRQPLPATPLPFCHPQRSPSPSRRQLAGPA